MPREKSRYRDKRSSSYSSESSHERKKSKSKHKRRSRSRDRSEYSESSSHRRKRSSSRSRHKRRSYSRSVSRDRYESKSRRRSSSRSRSKRNRSLSPSRTRLKRERSRSVSSTRSRSKYKSKKSKKSRSSTSRSSSYEPERPTITKKYQQENNKSEIEKAIKAAEAAGLTLQKIPTYEYKEVEIKEDMPTIHDRNLLAELNSDSFVQKSFSSSKNKKQNIVIDLNAQTVMVPEAEKREEKDDSIINFDELPSEEELREMWIRKVYQFRKKMVKGEM